MLVVNEGAGTEAFVSDQMQSSAVVLWRVRYRTDVLGSWELEFDSQRYEVMSALPEGRKRYTLIKTRLKDNA
jgi:head-tail adaptor